MTARPGPIDPASLVSSAARLAKAAEAIRDVLRDRSEDERLSGWCARRTIVGAGLRPVKIAARALGRAHEGAYRRVADAIADHELGLGEAMTLVLLLDLDDVRETVPSVSRLTSDRFAAAVAHGRLHVPAFPAWEAARAASATVHGLPSSSPRPRSPS